MSMDLRIRRTCRSCHGSGHIDHPLLAEYRENEDRSFHGDSGRRDCEGSGATTSEIRGSNMIRSMLVCLRWMLAVPFICAEEIEHELAAEMYESGRYEEGLKHTRSARRNGRIADFLMPKGEGPRS